MRFGWEDKVTNSTVVINGNVSKRLIQLPARKTFLNLLIRQVWEVENTSFSSARRTIPILLTMPSFVLLHHEMEYSFN